jgi:hypothetical protein
VFVATLKSDEIDRYGANYIAKDALASYRDYWKVDLSKDSTVMKLKINGKIQR